MADDPRRKHRRAPRPAPIALILCVVVASVAAAFTVKWRSGPKGSSGSIASGPMIRVAGGEREVIDQIVACLADRGARCREWLRPEGAREVTKAEYDYDGATLYLHVGLQPWDQQMQVLVQSSKKGDHAADVMDDLVARFRAEGWPIGGDDYRQKSARFQAFLAEFKGAGIEEALGR